MKYIQLVLRIVLGLGLITTGLNHFLGFLEKPELTGLAGQFADALTQSGYFDVIAILKIVGGALLVLGFMAPLGLVLVGPIVVNILLYHIYLDREGLPVALALSGLFLVVLASHGWAFRSIFRSRPVSTG